MSDLDGIAFAEKALALLDQGSFTATYKYAVLLALMDACLEGADTSGQAPAVVEVQLLAERVVELYWSHTNVFDTSADGAPVILRQNRGGQAEIVALLQRFRESADAGAQAPLSRARAANPLGYRRLVKDVAWKLAQMPLPRLQRFGQQEDRFVYDLDWDDTVTRREFESSAVNRVLRLRPGVADHLIRLAGLLRPLVQHQWARHVVAVNRHEVPALDEHGRVDVFLFGEPRIDLTPVRADLRDHQAGRCFYCVAPLKGTVEVDHFLPWARYPDNGIHNLVAAHAGCNNRKRDLLAACEHVERWAQRFHEPGLGRELADIATRRRWACHPDRTLGVARAVYLRLPAHARLWRADAELVQPDVGRLHRVLRALPLPLAAEDHAVYDPDGDPSADGDGTTPS